MLLKTETLLLDNCTSSLNQNKKEGMISLNKSNVSIRTVLITSCSKKVEKKELNLSLLQLQKISFKWMKLYLIKLNF